MHQQLDKSVEKAYGKIFKNDDERVKFLFKLYQEIIISQKTIWKRILTLRKSFREYVE